jgi:hypothetical protein
MVAKKKAAETGTEIVDWEAQMRRQAEIAAGAQRSAGGGGKFFSTQAGVLQFDGTPLPGNQMAVIILADIMENSYYDGPFDPDTPASPVCFAFGHDEEDMEPHEKVDQDAYFTRQNPQCHDCPRNEWGSADVGRGKACKNVMRLALIPAGQYKGKGTGRNQTFELELYDDPSALCQGRSGVPQAAGYEREELRQVRQGSRRGFGPTAARCNHQYLYRARSQVAVQGDVRSH